MLQRLIGPLLATLFCAAGAHAQESPRVFDPSLLKAVKGTPNEVMVLGTAHLSQLPAAFKPEHLQGLNARLVA
nr:hypothetical protein [uncultured Massilia sp.]